MKKLLLNLLGGMFPKRAARPAATLDLGRVVSDGEVTRRRVGIPHGERARSIAILGTTGSGKSFLGRHFAEQDIREDNGFLYYDLHGDATPFLVGTVAARERISGQDLSDRLIVVDPADPAASVGLNPLEARTAGNRFVEISEFTEVLKKRWHLDSFGARTDELLRNALYVLADNGLTLLELSLLLSHAAFRADCLQRTTNAEVREYFENRYDRVSEPMRATMREPILNKISAFTADPHFRHIIGQRQSTFSVSEALDSKTWIILNLHKGKLGEQAATLGSLFLTLVKHAIFARKSRSLFTLYCDEIQNLVSYGAEIDTILSEARKFSTGIISANQFTGQTPPDVRSALQAVGTHVYFQLSSQDAHQVSTSLDGGQSLEARLKNLPRQHFIVKTAQEPWREGVVPFVREPSIDFSDLLSRSQARWARKRSDVEQEIQARRAGFQQTEKGALHEWE